MAMVNEDDCGGLIMRMYINLQMEDHIRRLQDSTGMLGSREALTTVGINDEFLQNADRLQGFIEDHDSISGRDSIDYESWSSMKP